MPAFRIDPSLDTTIADAEEAAFRRDSRRDVRPVPRITIQAFCETHETQAAFDTAASDRCMARAHLKVQTGGIEAAVESYRDATTPNLVILESTERPQKLLAALSQFAEVCDPSSKVVIIGHVNDIQLYRQLVDQGVSEYVVGPVNALDIVEVISRLYVDPKSKPVGRTIAFVGAKGGVGASTIAHNVGWWVANDFQVDTIVADLDLAFGTANLDFNTDPPQGIAEAVFSPDRLDQNFLDRLLTNCGPHLNLLAAPSTLDRTYDFAEGAFEQLMDLVRHNSPAVILDVPHTWTAWTRKILVSADEIMVVATPDLANLRNAKNLIDLMKAARPHDPPPKLILNQVGMPKRPEIPPADFVKALDVQLAAVVPFDTVLFGTAANNGQMLFEVQKTSKVLDALKGVAEATIGRAPMKRAKGLALNLPFVGKLMDAVQSRKKA